MCFLYFIALFIVYVFGCFLYTWRCFLTFYRIELATQNILRCHVFLHKVVASKADLVFFFGNERNCRKAASSSRARLKGWKEIVKVTLLYESRAPRRVAKIESN